MTTFTIDLDEATAAAYADIRREWDLSVEELLVIAARAFVEDTGEAGARDPGAAFHRDPGAAPRRLDDRKIRLIEAHREALRSGARTPQAASGPARP